MTRILLLDIENSPNVSYTWGFYDQDVIAFRKEWYLLSFAYKWLGEKEVHALSLPDFPNFAKDKTDDSALCQSLADLLNEADIVIGHNIDRFDIRKSFARFLINGIKPPAPFRTIDTYKVAKKYFKFNVNSLNMLSRILKIGKKLEHEGADLWLKCMDGNKAAFKRMVEYNKQDVVLLEQLYFKLRPWVGNHPSIKALEGEDFTCPACGSGRLQKRGYAISGRGKRQRYQCLKCGKWSQGKQEKTITNL